MIYTLLPTCFVPLSFLSLKVLTIWLSNSQGLDSKFCMQHDMWTSKGNRHGFIGASVNYIDPSWKYVSQHLTLKVVAWEHRGVWLAEPLANVLIKNNLAEKISLIYLSISIST